MKTNFLCKNALPRGAGVFLKLVVTVTALLCSHLIAYAQQQPTLTEPVGGANVAIPVELEWSLNGPGISKVEIAECSPGTVANNIDLGGYELVGNPVAISTIPDDLSGITYNPLTNTLFMVQNGDPTVYETSLAGQVIRTITLSTDFNDTEGIVHLGGTRYAVSEERRGRIALFNITSSTTFVPYSDYVKLPGTWGPNTGLEGVSFNPADNTVHTVKEISDKAYYSFTRPTSFPTTLTNADVDIPCDVTVGGTVGPFNFTDIAGIHHLGLNNFVSNNLDPSISNHVLLLSQESSAIVETDDNCTEYSRLCLPLNEQIEGVTMDNNGVIYAVGEPNKLFIFSNANFSSGNSKKVIHTEVIGAQQYTIPGNILTAGVEYCWRVLNASFATCTWSESETFTPCSTGTTCDDGDACTENDTYNQNCECVGTAIPSCSGSTTVVACDDNDPCTINDVQTIDDCDGSICIPCAGTVSDTDNDGVCDVDDVCPGGDDTADADTDGVPDFCDTCFGGDDNVDTDGDGVADFCDACPSDPANSCIGDYCEITTNVNYSSVIESVTLNGQTNTSGDDDGYGDYTGTILATVGSMNTITITGVQNVRCSVWIDTNKDGDFDDAGEEVVDVDFSTNYIFAFSAPPGIGTTTMRVMVDGDDDPVPCYLTDGEAEDYTVALSPYCPDTDGDMVCDADDVCPGGDDNVDTDADGIPDYCDTCNTGTPCDDNDTCTVGDVYDANCNCVGIFQDADNDNVCDTDDVCPGFNDGLIGTPCDDNNDCTTNDVYTTNCECVGTPQDADSDGVCDADDVCPNFDDTLIGTPCDDGSVCTTNDVYTTDCECAGTPQDADGDGVCDADDACPNFDDTLIGTPCDDGSVCTVNDVYTPNCECVGVLDESSCHPDCLDYYDCDDNNPLTVNDVVGLSRNPSMICLPCAGTYTPGNCPIDINISVYDNTQTYYEVSNSITTVLDANVEVNDGEQFALNAGYYVKLQPGFNAKEGSNVRAYIEGCEPNGQKTEQSTLASVKHYPNPFRDEVILEFSLDADAEAQIIISDVNGRMVAQLSAEQLYRGTQTTNISTENWVPGIYFYQIQIREQNTGILSHANGTLIKM